MKKKKYQFLRMQIHTSIIKWTTFKEGKIKPCFASNSCLRVVSYICSSSSSMRIIYVLKFYCFYSILSLRQLPTSWPKLLPIIWFWKHEQICTSDIQYTVENIKAWQGERAWLPYLKTYYWWDKYNYPVGFLLKCTKKN